MEPLLTTSIREAFAFVTSHRAHLSSIADSDVFGAIDAVFDPASVQLIGRLADQMRLFTARSRVAHERFSGARIGHLLPGEVLVVKAFDRGKCQDVLRNGPVPDWLFITDDMAQRRDMMDDNVPLNDFFRRTINDHAIGQIETLLSDFPSCQSTPVGLRIPLLFGAASFEEEREALEVLPFMPFLDTEIALTMKETS